MKFRSFYLRYIWQLNLDTRTLHSLLNAGIYQIANVKRMDDNKLLSIRNFGMKSLNKLNKKLNLIRHFEGDTYIWR